ncbi:MAG: (d)CMP kinase [Actinobacteria bacterium]|nr:(d)CMP kinase [Actinomycetota bacterium]MBW3649662.1 (d)CMP kinase [Actinomycetota bacterium]
MSAMKIIAIDGPAGSGKSTVAKAVASRLGLPYLDTGAMYRAVAFAALRRSVDLTAADALAALAEQLDIHVAERVVVDGEDATDAIRGPAVTRAVSAIAATPPVRAEMVRRQQAWAREQGGGVVEGRDIGTVVFPEADLKVYLIADEDERLRRRARESGDEVAQDIARRDQADTSRAVSPMMAAPDALIIDTTGRAVADIVEEVLSRL